MSRRSTKVNPYRYRAVHHPPHLCRRYGADTDLFLLIAVISPPDAAVERDAVRRTWASFQRSNGTWPSRQCGVGADVEVVFVVGLRGQKKWYDDNDNNSKVDYAMIGEINRFQDILLGDFVDSYNNLTLKTLFILKTMSEMEPCRQARYLLKCDIDVFVNVPHLVTALQKYKTSRRNILGLLSSNVAFRRGKYAVTMEEYPFDRYPLYAAGPSYVISNDLSPELFGTSEYVPFFRMEDVYVTGILPVIIGGIHHVMLPGVKTMGFSGNTLTGCDVITDKITTRSEVPAEQKIIIWKVMENNQTCA